MDKESFGFWLVPMIALFVGFAILGYTIDYKINTITPNAIPELTEIKEMSCDEIQIRNGIGSYWTPENGKIARDKVKQCIDDEKAYKTKLRDIRNIGTHQEKLDAGFNKLWFGVYDHPDLPFRKEISVVPIPLGTVSNENLYPSEITVISGYNDTIKFVNEDEVPIWLSENHGKFGFGLIQTNETQSIQVSEPGVYSYYSKPWQTGILTVLDLERNTEN